MQRFLDDIEKSIRKHFVGYRIEFLLKTSKSLKARVYINDNYFIAVRYNARNSRIDVALIKDSQRIFGYDNLKKWHYHPYGSPADHISCDQPSIEKIISDTKKYFEMDRQKMINE
jgi:hypothetical protein